MLQRIEHENIVSVRETLRFEGSFSAVFEHMPMSFSLFIGFQKYLDEDQLTSILGQKGSDAWISPSYITDCRRYLTVLCISQQKCWNMAS